LGGALLGGIVGATSFAALAATPHNPVAPTQASLDRGGAIYSERCAVCHGDTGRGDGPAAFGLNPRPADLRVHLAAGHTDAQLFDWISNGYPNSAMPSFKSDLSEEDRWNIINYLRSSFGPGS
jgi:mono/diheme cytochrome c family protein